MGGRHSETDKKDDSFVKVSTRLGLVPLFAALLALLLGAATVAAQDYTVNLKETDIQELIKFVAEATGTTIVVDPAVKGKVKGAEETMKGMEETMEGTESSMERTRRGKPRAVARRGAGGWAQGAWRAWASERGR